MVLLIVGLTAATYVASTLFTALRLAAPATAERAARSLGISVATLTAVLALAGLRIGAFGSGGEIIPTLAVSIAAATALGSSAACALLASARGLERLGAGRRRRFERLTEGRKQNERWREATVRRRLDGIDLADEVEGADAALARLKAALAGLTAARDGLVEKLRALGDDAASSLGVDLRRAHTEVETKLSLGERVLVAAEAAAFRLAVNEPLRRLARRRPSEATLGLERLGLGLGLAAGAPSAEVLARLAPAHAALAAFLTEIGAARRALNALAARRPAGIPAGTDEDPWTLAQRDLAALHLAFTAVKERVEVVQVHHAARGAIAEVAEAAGALAGSARSRGEGQTELESLAAEVTRAEAAAIMATPIESDAKSLTAALARSTAALTQTDGASLDELLGALRSIA